MASFLDLKTKTDPRGSLTVIEKILPFEIKRVYYIYDVDPALSRGRHRHKKTVQALICLRGSCRIKNHNGMSSEEFVLDKPDLCLLLQPEDFHIMDQFTSDALLLVLSSDYYDPEDYIHEPYPGWID